MHPRDTRRAGAAFLLGSIFFGYAFALRVSPGVMVDDLMRDFRVGAAILGNLSAFYFGVALAVAIYMVTRDRTPACREHSLPPRISWTPAWAGMTGKSVQSNRYLS